LIRVVPIVYARSFTPVRRMHASPRAVMALVFGEPKPVSFRSRCCSESRGALRSAPRVMAFGISVHVEMLFAAGESDH